MLLRPAYILILMLKIKMQILKRKVGDHVRVSKYKNIYPKDYSPNWSEKAFFIKKSKVLSYWQDLNCEKVVGMPYEK